jgi:hypothetical protein
MFLYWHGSEITSVKKINIYERKGKQTKRSRLSRRRQQNPRSRRNNSRKRRRRGMRRCGDPKAEIEIGAIRTEDGKSGLGIRLRVWK